MATTDSHKFQLDQIDGLHDGLFENFDEEGNWFGTLTWRNGELVETNENS